MRRGAGVGRGMVRPVGIMALGARRSALGARRSALGARRSALGARRLGARRSALGARRSALGARRSALGARRSALLIPLFIHRDRELSSAGCDVIDRLPWVRDCQEETDGCNAIGLRLSSTISFFLHRPVRSRAPAARPRRRRGARRRAPPARIGVRSGPSPRRRSALSMLFSRGAGACAAGRRGPAAHASCAPGPFPGSASNAASIRLSFADGVVGSPVPGRAGGLGAGVHRRGADPRGPTTRGIAGEGENMPNQKYIIKQNCMIRTASPAGAGLPPPARATRPSPVAARRAPAAMTGAGPGCVPRISRFRRSGWPKAQPDIQHPAQQVHVSCRIPLRQSDLRAEIRRKPIINAPSREWHCRRFRRHAGEGGNGTTGVSTVLAPTPTRPACRSAPREHGHPPLPPCGGRACLLEHT